MITENLSTLKIHKLTQEQYERELEAGRIDENAIYITPNEKTSLDEYITEEQASSVYETKNSASAKLTEAKSYTDEKFAVASERTNDLEDLVGSIPEGSSATSVVDYINIKTAGVSTDAALEELQLQLNGKAEKSHSHDDKYYTETEVDEMLSGKASSTHSHAITDVTDLKTTLDAKAEKSNLDAHVSDTTVHITSTERNNWNSAKTHADSAHAPSNAEKNQNAFSNVTVGSTTIAADSATDTLTIVAGENVTITPDANNDKITISATDTNTTYSAGAGITLSGTEFRNSGVRSISTGSTNGTISVNTNGTTEDVAVKGLGSAAYTASTAYDAKGSADAALASAKTYADNAATTVKNDLLNGAGTAYDTLKELGNLIDDNKDAIDALETVAAGKADKTHSHAIADVYGLQSALDGKAASSHGVHVEYSTTAPVMDGSASAGTASTVARSDHKHPTDTSRASKTEFDTHVSDTTAHMTSTQKSQLTTAYNHSQVAHAPSNAQANQNAFSNIAVSGQTTVAADTTTDTVTFAGSNVSITTDATNDKVTFSVADASTSAKGVVKLSDSTSDLSSGTAATSYSVTMAYMHADLANKYAAEVEIKALDAYSLAESKVGSLSDLGVTATSTELNYVDGVTSNIQTQLDGKVPTSRTVNGKALTGNITLSASDVGAYSKTEIDNIELVTISDIDAICGGSIVAASEVLF